MAAPTQAPTQAPAPLPPLPKDPVVLAAVFQLYLKRTATTAAALGRAVTPNDHQVVYRIIKKQSVNPFKLELYWEYIHNNPDGPEDKGDPRKAMQRQNRAPAPPKAEGDDEEDLNKPAACPAPALSELPPNKAAWVKQEAFKQGKPIGRFLCELTELGILTYLEDLRESQTS